MSRIHTSSYNSSYNYEAVFLHKSHSYRGGIIKQSYMLQYSIKCTQLIAGELAPSEIPGRQQQKITYS
jgi:hypothetical protein